MTSQHRSSLNSTTQEGPQPLRTSSTETQWDNSSPGTIPDFDAGSTTVSGSRADIQRSVLSTENASSMGKIVGYPHKTVWSDKKGVREALPSPVPSHLRHTCAAKRKRVREPPFSCAFTPSPGTQRKSAAVDKLHQSRPLLKSCVQLIRHVVQQHVHLGVLGTIVSQRFKPTRTSSQHSTYRHA